MKNKFITGNGFTIVEMIITLSLLGIILAVIYTLFFHVQSGFNKADAHLKINQQINMTFLQMEQDIHSATKPNYLTDAVRIVSDSEMHIYAHDETKNKYIRIVYRLNPSEKTILERGTAICQSNLPPSYKNPEYESISQWETYIEGIVEKNDGKKSSFTLVPVPTKSLNPTPTPIIRRAVNVILIVNDPKHPMKDPIVSEKLLTSRSNSYPK